ncbi:hypothetical protein [Paenibacillus barcinonensis]|uniref:hypothetical protein n=1 Tax=Paenibacillus barcinonensis TaxID=198119 RepID=UPI001ABF7CF4|nr:hypothetical protein [Paenibacillus barcinonensis]
MNIEKMTDGKAAAYVRPTFYSLGSLLRLLFSWNEIRDGLISSLPAASIQSKLYEQIW